jgi:hypothetical protein
MFTDLPGFDMPIRAAVTGDDLPRTFRGIGVPWNQEITIWGETEQFARGAIVESEDALIFWQHSEPIGKLLRAADSSAGWDIYAQLSTTPRADEALTLLRDGVISKLSVRFEPLEWTDNAEGVRTYTRARVREISLVPFPAYSQASISSVRSKPKESSHRMTPEEIAAAALARSNALDAAVNERTAPMADQLRQLDATVTGFADTLEKRSTPDTEAATQWRSSGDFLKALASGDSDAAEFHRAFTEQTAQGDDFRRAYTGSTSADNKMTSTWLSDEIRLIESRRKITNTFAREALPAEGLTLEYLKIASNSIAVTAQVAEGDDLAFGKIVLTSATTPVGTYGGYTQLTRQQIERSSAPMLSTSKRAMDLEYARTSERRVRTTFLAAVAAQAAIANGSGSIPMPMLSAAKASDWLDAIVDAAELYEDRGHDLTGMKVSKDVFKTLYRLTDGAGNRLFNVYGAGTNVTGEINVRGLSGILANLPVTLVTGTTAPTAAFYDPEALTTWEQPGAPMQLQDENIINLSQSFSTYGYLAAAAQFPEAIVPVKFATV